MFDKIHYTELQVNHAHIECGKGVFGHDAQKSVYECERVYVVESRFVISAYHIQRTLTSCTRLSPASHSVAQCDKHFIRAEFCYAVSISRRTRPLFCITRYRVSQRIFRRTRKGKTISVVRKFSLLALFQRTAYKPCQNLSECFFVSVALTHDKRYRALSFLGQSHYVAAYDIVVTQLLDYTPVELVVDIDGAFDFFLQFSQYIAYAFKLSRHKLLVNFEFLARRILDIVRKRKMIAVCQKRGKLYTFGRKVLR